jgi:predicted transposase YbfD/YdcC
VIILLIKLILQKHKGIYQVKNNQKHLLQNIKELVKYNQPVERLERKGGWKHGRRETRIIEIYRPENSSRLGLIYDPDWFLQVKKTIKQTKITERRSWVNKKRLFTKTTTHSYFITNKITQNLNSIANQIRNHWKIEVFHWHRDNNFKEDSSRIRINVGVIARLRTLVYNIFKGQRVKSIKAELENNSFMEGGEFIDKYKELWYVG